MILVGIKAILVALFWITIGIGWLTAWLLLVPFRSVHYMWRFRWGRTWLIGFALVLAVIAVGHGVKMYLAERAARLDAERHALILSQELEGQRDANYAIYAKLEQQPEDRGRHVSAEGKTYIASLVKKYFGTQSETALRVFNCESGLSPFNVNTKNAPGLGIDAGVAQINERWHKERFERMYGVPYEIGIYDPDLNLQYAKYLWDHSGPGPWVCAKIVGALANS